MESGGSFRRYGRSVPGGYDETHAAAPASSRRVDELVGGTLASQECAGRLKTLEERADGFDEKVLNLTRLVQLAQGLAAEREEELRQENAELRSRLKRQEQVTAHLQGELESLKVGLADQVRAALEPELASRDVEQRASLTALEGELNKAQHALELVSQEQLRQAQVVPQFAADLDATREWVKRNLQRLKQHVDVANENAAGLQQQQASLTSGLQQVECKAEVEYKKLRLLLQKRTKESEALMALLERELVEVHKVARDHRVLQSSDIDIYVDGDEVPGKGRIPR